MYKVKLQVKRGKFLVIEESPELSTEAEIVGFFHSIIEELLDFKERADSQPPLS